MKIAVIGCRGQLGSDICEKLTGKRFSVSALDTEQLDIADLESTQKALTGIPDLKIVINTAAMHHVEKCENDPLRAYAVNALGSRNLAMVCNQLQALLIHISTDYVFDGKKKTPYRESDLPLPLNVYANSKLAGEYFVQAIARNYYILRVSGIYGKNPCIAKGYNFVDMMLKLAREREFVRVVDNEILTPTFTEDIADQLIHMIGCQAKTGLYHVTAEGSCSWYEFAGEIFRLAKVTVDLQKALPGEFAIKVNRPEYSVLENAFLKEQKLNIMPPWQEGLRKFIQTHRLGKNNRS